jgi:uncharacterized membrane protein
MMPFFAGYLASLVTFVAADMVWLGTMAPRFYRPTLGDIAISGINFPPAMLFYIVYPVGLFIFSINPALKSGSITTAIIYGALFGFFTYATYDLTNHATLRNWTTQLTMIDVAWGTFLASVASAVGFLAANKLVGGG